MSLEPEFSNSQVREIYYTLEGLGNYIGIAYGTIKPISTKPEFTDFTIEKEGVLLKWKEEPGAVGYKIYRKQGKEKYQLVKKIALYDTTSWIDTDALKIKDSILYYIKAYTKNDSRVLNTDASDKKSLGSKIEKCRIKLSEKSFTYDGKLKKPSVTISYNGKELEYWIDYSISYKNNRNAGTVSIRIKGYNGYRDTTEKTFWIKKAPQKLKASIASNVIIKGKTARIKISGSVGKVTYASQKEKVATVSKMVL